MRRWSLFSQLLAGIVLVLGVTMLAGVWVSRDALSEKFAEVLAEELRAHASDLAALLDGPDLRQAVSAMPQASKRRITVISLEGDVVADSSVAKEDLSQVENHASRPEVRAAMQTGWGWRVGYSPTTGRDFLYVAVKPENRHYVLRVAVPLAQYERWRGELNHGVTVSIVLGGLLALLLAFAIARRLGAELREITTLARRRAAGERVAFGERSNADFQKLTRTLDAMTRQLDARVDEIELERARLRAVVDTMIEGVVLCNAEGEVVLWNAAFERLFDWQPDVKPKKLIEITRAPEVVRLSDKAARQSDPLEEEFEFGTRTVEATFVPLRPRGPEGYVAVFHDITDLKRADRIRRDFVANVSHELRTPLASISGYTESLLDGAIDDPQVAGPFVDGINRNAERLKLLIEDLLDLARIESGRYPLTAERVDLHAAVENAGKTVTRIEGKGQSLLNEVPTQMTVKADSRALGQILVNLIENAAKYSPNGSIITVRAEREDDNTTVSVADNGPGIPAGDLPRIFERFFRGDRSRNAAGEPGTGLGLAICKHLVTEMGGQIAASSSAQGTIVTVTLPAV